MARIRTIKPEFFTSEDIVSLSPLARLFYVSLWCEADREGRLSWKPATLKMRYLPGDNCDVDTLAQELIDSDLVVLYEADGKTYAEIPTFKNHQVINNRESVSVIPPRVHGASGRVKAEGRKEGKGREGKEGVERSPNGSRLPPDWVCPDDWIAFCRTERPDLDPEVTACRFADYWRGVPGQKGRKLDWAGTWRNWVRGEKAQSKPFAQQAADVARATVPSRQGPDPALQKIIEDQLKAVPPSAEVREKLMRTRAEIQAGKT